MSVYLIFTREKTLDEHELSLYSQGAAATLAGHEFKVLSLYGAHQDLEGGPTEGTVIMEFPDERGAMLWYDSPGYQEVRQHRFKGARYRVTLVHGSENR